MNIKRIFIIFSIIAVFSNSFAEIKNLEEREFYFDVKDKDLQIVNLAANKANLSEILEVIYQKTGISIKIERDRKNELITLNLIELPLSTVLKKMIRENYVMIFQKTEKGFMLSDGKALNNSNRENSFDEVNDFTGMIVIDGTVAKMFYSTEDETFSDSEQALAKTYLEAGGKMIVSGSEIGWDFGVLFGLAVFLPVIPDFESARISSSALPRYLLWG